MPEIKPPKGAICGHPKANGEPCKHPAGARTSHKGFGACWRHSGRTPGRIKEAERLKAEHAVATLGLPRKVDPHTALLEEVWRAAGHVAWLEGEIRKMAPEAIVWGLSRETLGKMKSGELAVVQRDYTAQPTIWLELYLRERRQLVEAARTAIACGIAERQVRIAEEQGAAIVRAFYAVAERFGLDVSRDEVRLALREQLLLEAGGPAS